MPLAIASSGTLQGIEALPVEVEVNTGENGDPKLIMVGLPDTAVKESNDRVLSALANSGFRTPETRSTINLAPGNIRKEGPLFDLPIGLALMTASGQVRPVRELSDYLIAGELSLSGETRPIRGGLALGILARKQKKAAALLPPKAAEEAALVDGLEVYCVSSLDEARAFMEGNLELPKVESHFGKNGSDYRESYDIDFSDVKGQQSVRRAVEVAVAGGHNMLIIGPPGSGKSMIAKRIPTIMPDPTLDEYLEILSVHSAAGYTLKGKEIGFQRPYRAPHHTISDVGLLGGGVIPGPGEISLAHNGVLFLDELPEFKRSTLEVLRQPLEDGEVSISRSAGKVTLPASFILVAAMNPTPSGYSSKDGRNLLPSAQQIQRYRSRISGPLLDRIDIHIEAPALKYENLRDETPGESSASMRKRICKAREHQQSRYSDPGITCNARMQHKQIRKFCHIDSQLSKLLENAMQELQLSARAYDRILKVARTIADLADSESIEALHLLEAIQYRSLDRTLFY